MRVLVMGYNACDVIVPVTGPTEPDSKVEVTDIRIGGGGPAATAGRGPGSARRRGQAGHAPVAGPAGTHAGSGVDAPRGSISRIVRGTPITPVRAR